MDPPPAHINPTAHWPLWGLKLATRATIATSRIICSRGADEPLPGGSFDLKHVCVLENARNEKAHGILSIVRGLSGGVEPARQSILRALNMRTGAVRGCASAHVGTCASDADENECVQTSLLLQKKVPQ